MHTSHSGKYSVVELMQRVTHNQHDGQTSKNQQDRKSDQLTCRSGAWYSHRRTDADLQAYQTDKRLSIWAQKRRTLDKQGLEETLLSDISDKMKH